MGNSQATTLAAIRECRDHIAGMCAPLDDSQWHAPTLLPGWDVQDVVAHLGSLEGMLLGAADPATDGDDREWPYVHNVLGAINERLVDRRRAWSPALVLAEFEEMSERRLEYLEGLSEADLDDEVPAPAGGMVPLRRFIGVRLWDFVVHELDIADALGRQPRVDSPGTAQVLDEMAFLLPRAWAKGGAPEGSTVRIDLPPSSRVLASRLTDGRGVLDDIAAGEATLHLRASPAAFLRVATGRQAPGAAIDGGSVAVDGDAHLAAAVLERLNVVP